MDDPRAEAWAPGTVVCDATLLRQSKAGAIARVMVASGSSPPAVPMRGIVRTCDARFRPEAGPDPGLTS
jgi:hypothetical protein